MPTGVYLHKSHSKSTREKISASKEGKRLSPEHKTSLSNSHLGKSLSLNHRRSISVGNTGKKRTLEQCRSMSLCRKGIEFSIEHRRNLSKSMMGHKHTEDTKRRIGKASSNPSVSIRLGMSQRATKMLQEGKWGRGTSKAQWFTDRLGRCMYLRSSYEVQFAQFLESKSLTWVYQPKAFLDADGIHHVLPDFYVQEWGSYVEVKPWDYREDAYDMKRILECLHGEKCLIVMESELDNLLANDQR